MRDAVGINPKILEWARETAGLSPVEAAAKLGLKNSVKRTAVEKLAELEAGERSVSPSLLEKAAEVYRRPLVAFYLNQPPPRAQRGDDFRTTAGAASPREDAILDALIRDIRSRQQMLREVLLDDADTRPLPFVGSSRVGDGASEVAGRIRKALGVTPSAQRRARGADGLFALLRGATEQAGVFVLLLGDLGSYHSDVSEEVFRGFALADEIAPFVIINDNDAKVARSFTLLHELAHIWIGATGVSGPLRGTPVHTVERFCNDVAGQFLLPAEAMDGLSASSLREADAEHLLILTEGIGRAWNVSQGVVTYRLLQNRWIDDALASEVFRGLAERWRTERQRTKENRTADDRSPPPNVLRRARLGAALLGRVRRALQEDALTHTKAARILGVPPTAVDELLRERQRAA